MASVRNKMKNKDNNKEIAINIQDLYKESNDIKVAFASIKMTGYEMEQLLKAVFLARQWKELDKMFEKLLQSRVDDNEVYERYSSLKNQLAQATVEALLNTTPSSNP